MKMKILTDVYVRFNRTGEKIYCVTGINDQSKIVICYLPAKKQEVFVKNNAYIVRGVRSWQRDTEVFIECDQQTKIICVQSNFR